MLDAVDEGFQESGQFRGQDKTRLADPRTTR
jgi:hypothetical protein